jgi:hypothetical protein
MVAAVSFIVIFNSYSSLGITFNQVLSIALHAFGISFLLARAPQNGAYLALTLLCTGFGQGFESGYLILRPLAFYLIAVGVFMDVMISGFANFIVARLNGFASGEKNMSQFI